MEAVVKQVYYLHSFFKHSVMNMNQLYLRICHTNTPTMGNLEF